MLKLKQSANVSNRVMELECSCGAKSSFTGLACPIVCDVCYEVLPDVLDLLYEGADRLTYHLDDEGLLC